MSSVEAVEAVTEQQARREPAVKTVRRTFSHPVASLFMIVLTVVWTIPTIGLLVTSFRPAGQVATTGWWTILTHPSFTGSNYHTVLFVGGYGVSNGLLPYLINSLAITIPGTIFPLVVASMAAYALAWIRFRGSDAIFFTIFALQVVPLQMALIPLLQLYNGGAHASGGLLALFSPLSGIFANQTESGSATIVPNLHLTGTYWPVWLSHTMFAMPLAVFLLHNFIAQLPREVMEAAAVDGASHFKIFRSIVLPLATPALASFAIFQFLWVWNDLLVGLTFAGGTPKVAPLIARINQLSGSFGSHWELLTAGAFISMLVPLAVFFALQRYFVRGLLAGSVKG
jgi:alpha-glucoside transport system permease protein